MSTNWFPQLAIPGLTCQTIRPHRKDATPSKHESVQGRSRTAQTQHHHRLGDPSGFVAAILKAALYDGKYEVLKGNSQTEPQKPAVCHIRPSREEQCEGDFLLRAAHPTSHCGE
jgi:hypothetical protein